MNIRRILALAPASLILASCYAAPAPTHWDNPKTSVEQQQADQAECRQRAMYQIERDAERAGPFASEQRDAQLQKMFDRHDQAARERQLYENCLRDKGYLPVISGGR